MSCSPARIKVRDSKPIPADPFEIFTLAKHLNVLYVVVLLEDRMWTLLISTSVFGAVSSRRGSRGHTNPDGAPCRRISCLN